MSIIDFNSGNMRSFTGKHVGAKSAIIYDLAATRAKQNEHLKARALAILHDGMELAMAVARGNDLDLLAIARAIRLRDEASNSMIPPVAPFAEAFKMLDQVSNSDLGRLS